MRWTHHFLQTKPVREPVKVERVEVVRDSLVYRDRVQTVTVEVEKELTWWQRFRLSLGNIFFALIVIAILYLLSLLFNNFLKLKR